MKTSAKKSTKNLLSGLFILLFTVWQALNPILLWLSRKTFIEMMEAANTNQQAYDELSGRWERIGQYWNFVRGISTSIVFWLLILAVVVIAFYFWGTRRTLVVSGLTLGISIGLTGIITFFCSRGIEAFSSGDVIQMLREVAIGGVAATALGYVIYFFAKRVKRAQ